MEVPKTPAPGHSFNHFVRTDKTLGPNELAKRDLEAVVAGTDLVRSHFLPTANLPPVSEEGPGISPSTRAPGKEDVSDIGNQFLGRK